MRTPVERPVHLRFLTIILLLLASVLPAASADKAELIALAERGWKYEYRGSFRRGLPKLPASHLLAKTMAKRDVCLLGEEPHPLIDEIITDFRVLLGGIYGEIGQLGTRAPTVLDCPETASVFIRLYTRRLPDIAFNRDLQDLNVKFAIGMTGQAQAILSPAQAVTFFGKKGKATHIILLQPHRLKMSPLQIRFYRSLLIEELYQTYSFGIDIFKAEPGGPFMSKLQEGFVNLQGQRWLSKTYMEGLLSSNPDGLCAFDAMMLHAIGAVPETVDTSAGFIDYVSENFEQLREAAQNTFEGEETSGLFDPECLPIDPVVTAQ